MSTEEILTEWTTHKMKSKQRLQVQEIYDAKIAAKLFHARNSKPIVDVITQKTQAKNPRMSHSEIDSKTKSVKTRLQNALQYMTTTANEQEKYQGSDRYRVMTTTYKQAPGYGRMTVVKGGVSQFPLPRVIRATLCSEIYHDLDMVNAHPCILLEYIRRYPEYLTHNASLAEYVSRRDDFFVKVRTEHPTLTDDDIKTIVLTGINNGGSASEFPESPTLCTYFTEMKRTIEEMNNLAKAHKEYKELGLYRSVRTKDNVPGKVINRFLMFAENHILWRIREKIIEMGGSPGPLCNDGIMITKQYDDALGVFTDEYAIHPDRLPEIEEYVYQTTEFPVKLKYKPMIPMDLNLIKDFQEPKKFDVTDVELYETHCDITSNTQKRIITNGKRAVYYHEDSRTWTITDNSLEIGLMITKTLREHYKSTLQDVALIIQAEKRLGSKQIASTLGSMALSDKGRRDPQFFINLNTTSPHLLPILDGKVVDLRTNATRDRTDQDMFTYEVRRKKVPLTPPEANRLLGIFSEYFTSDGVIDVESRDSFLNALGYSLTGLQTEKKFFVLVGETNTGKSTLFNIIHNTTESSDVVTSVNPSLVCDDLGVGGIKSYHDSVSKGQRLGYCSEFGENMVMNKETIKRLSGDDRISYRAMYIGEVEYKPTAKIWIFTNEVPQVDVNDEALVNRMHVFEFVNRFTTPTQQQRDNLDWVKSNPDLLFTFLCRRAKDYYTQGIPTSKASKLVKDTIIEDMDPISTFVYKCIEKVDLPPTEFKGPAKALLDGYLTPIDVWDMYLDYAPEKSRISRKKFDASILRHLDRTKVDTRHNGKRITRIYHAKAKGSCGSTLLDECT